MLLISTFVEIRVGAGKTRKRVGLPHAVSGRPMPVHTCHAIPVPRCAVALRCRFQNGKFRGMARCGMACVNQIRPHRVNEMGKTLSKLLAARHGKGTAWERHGMCV
jgi:hypothetical protein